MSLRSIPRAKTALPSPLLGNEGERDHSLVLMRVVMPLFEFQIDPDSLEFVFSDGRLSIRRFDDDKHLSDLDIFSKQDRRDIEQERWAIVAEGDDLSGYETDISMLLMTFQLLSNRITPFIKFRLSEDHGLARRMNDTAMHIRLRGYLYQTYSFKDFPHIDAVYMMLRKAEQTSVRLKNAFYFLYRAFHSYQWVDSFLFYMNALEALFSLDTKGPATKTICERASKLLKAPKKWSEKTIEDLYGVRSRIAHGRLEARPNSITNLRLLKKMERLTKLCFRKLIDRNSFQHFTTASARDRFMAAL